MKMLIQTGNGKQMTKTPKETFERVSKEYRKHYPVYEKAKKKFLQSKGKDLAKDFQLYKPIRERHKAFLKELDILESLICD